MSAIDYRERDKGMYCRVKDKERGEEEGRAKDDPSMYLYTDSLKCLHSFFCPPAQPVEDKQFPGLGDILVKFTNKEKERKEVLMGNRRRKRREREYTESPYPLAYFTFNKLEDELYFL